MANNDDDIEFDEFDDFDDEMSFDELMGNKSYPEPKNDREAIEQSASKAMDGFSKSFTDNEVSDIAEDFIAEGLPSQLKVNTDKVNELHTTLRDELQTSIKEVKTTGHSLLSTLENFTDEGSVGKSLIDKARNALGIHGEDEYHQESQEEIINKRVLEDVTDLFGEKEEQDKKDKLLSEQIAFYRNKKTNELQATSIALLTRQNTFNEKYTANFYRKSLELQFHSLYTNKELLKVTLDSANNDKVVLSEIVKNTALPDITKQRKSEQLAGMMRDDMLKGIKDTLYSSLDFSTVAKERIKSRVEGMKDSAISVMSTTDSLLGGLAQTQEMGGSKEGMLGGLIADSIKNKLYTSVGDVYRKTKYGQKHIDDLDKVMLDPHEVFSKKYHQTTGLKSLLYGGMASLYQQDNLNNDVSIDKDNLDSVAQFDNRTYTTLNTVIPTWLSKIYGAIKVIGTNDKEVISKFDYNTGNIVSNEDINVSISNKVTSAIKDSGTYSYSNRLIEIFTDDGIKINRSLQRDIVSGFLKYLMDGKSLHPDNLFRSGLLSKQYFRPNVSKQVKKILKSYLYTGDKETQLTRRHTLYNVLKGMRDNIPSAKLLLHSDIKDNNLDNLQELGLLNIDEHGNSSIDMDNYKNKVVSTIKNNLEYIKQEKEEVEKSELENYFDSKKDEFNTFKDKQKEKFEKTTVGNYIMDKVDKLSEFDTVEAVETTVDKSIDAGKQGIAFGKKVKDGEYAKEDLVKDVTKVKNKVEKVLSKENLENIRDTIELEAIKLETTLPDKFEKVVNDVKGSKVNRLLQLQKHKVKKRYNNFKYKEDVDNILSELDKGGKHTIQVVKDIKDDKYDIDDAKVVRDTLANYLTKEELTKLIPIKDLSIKKTIEDKIPDSVNELVQDTKSTVENSTTFKHIEKGIEDVKKDKRYIDTTETIKDAYNDSKEHLEDSIKVVKESKIVKDVTSSTMYKTIETKVQNIKDRGIFKTIHNTLKDKYQDVKNISSKDIEDIAIEVTSTIDKGGKVSDINKILDSTLEIKVEEQERIDKSETISKEILEDIEDERVLMNFGRFGKLVKLTGKDSILRKNIFQLVSDVKKKVTGKGLDNVPSTLEAMLLPYKYALKSTKLLGKGVYKTGKLGYKVGKSLIPSLNMDYKKGAKSIGNTYSTVGKKGLDLGTRAVKGMGSLGGNLLSGLGKLSDIGYESSDKISKTYSTIGKHTSKVIDPTVSVLNTIGTNIVSAMGKLINVDYKKANDTLATDIAVEIDKKNDENRNEGKVRKGSYITRLLNLTKKDKDPTLVKPNVKDIVKQKPTNAILSLLTGLTGTVSGIFKGVTSSLGFLGTIAGGIMGLVGIKSLLKMGGKKLGTKLGVKASTKVASKVGAKIAEKTVAKAGLKVAGKTVGKSLLKKIPGIGLLAGLGFAWDRFSDGDILGGVGEIASGVTSLVPGIGTVASIGIDAMLAKRDIDKANENQDIPLETPVTKPKATINLYTKDENSKTEPKIEMVENNIARHTTSIAPTTRDIIKDKPTPVNNATYKGNGQHKIMNYLKGAEGDYIHKNKKESDITFPYGIYRKEWKGTELEHWYKDHFKGKNLLRDRKEINATVNSNPDMKQSVENLAYKFYTKHFMDKRVNNVLDEDEQLIFFSNSVNGGKGRGVKALQSAVGAKVDGGVGNETLNKVKEAKSKGVDVARGMISYMKSFYDGLIVRNPSKYGINKNGWNNRLNTLRSMISDKPVGVSPNMLDSVNNTSYKTHKQHTSIKPTTIKTEHTEIPIVHDVKVSKPTIVRDTPKVPVVSVPSIKVDKRSNIIDKDTLVGHKELYDRLDKQIELQTDMLHMLKKIYEKDNIQPEVKTQEKIVTPPVTKNKGLPPPVITLQRKQYGT